MSPSPKVQFRAGNLADALASRTDMPSDSGLSEVAFRDLTRYYELMALSLSSVTLTVEESGLIVDALNGSIISTASAQLLAWEIQDSLGDGLAAKWGVYGPALVAKIGTWSLAQRMAVCDAVERFWRGDYHAVAGEAIADKLVAVGLIRRA